MNKVEVNVFPIPSDYSGIILSSVNLARVATDTKSECKELIGKSIEELCTVYANAINNGTLGYSIEICLNREILYATKFIFPTEVEAIGFAEAYANALLKPATYIVNILDAEGAAAMFKDKILGALSLLNTTQKIINQEDFLKDLAAVLPDDFVQ